MDGCLLRLAAATAPTFMNLVPPTMLDFGAQLQLIIAELPDLPWFG
jgi:hypothetical protein